MTTQTNGEWVPRPATSFERGHEVNRTHGAYTPRLVEPRAAELVDAAVMTVPYLADGAYRRAVLGWARAEARCDLLAEYLEEHGILDEDGAPRSALDAAAKYERLAAEARARLGLDPTSRVRLERDLADAGIGQVRLEAALSEGRRLRETAADGAQAGQMATFPPPPDLPAAGADGAPR